jgi:6-phosphogluconolactonase/glucosamine-6-phosphate isomerase/deaminase
MITQLQQIISHHQLILEPKEPFVVTVKDALQGCILAKDILYSICDKKTALFLSGGRTPKQFYQMVAQEERLTVGAVGLIDERYGPPMHEQSNEQMIQQTGLIGYLHYKHVPFYSILTATSPILVKSEIKQSTTIEDATTDYDETLRVLFNSFSKSIGILGIGLDGHTAGIPVGKKEQENKQQSLVTYFTDFPGPQKERISMTFLGLSMLDLNIVLV